MEITFLGATNTVTGSKFLIKHNSSRLLVDCGLYQGYKHLRLRNRAPLPFEPEKLDAVLLTHAHIDHSGYLPLLVKKGFEGPIYSTEATNDLCEILLPDSGKIHEEDAAYANKKGFSKHKPAKPLYTEKDALNSLKQFKSLPYEEKFTPVENLTAQFLQAGHILGASLIRLDGAETSLLFSGDLGRLEDPLMLPPESGHQVDYLVMESTYGTRTHEDIPPEQALARVIKQTTKRDGTTLIPAFAVGRSQVLLYYLQQLMAAGEIPELPVYLDSPMAVKVTDIFSSSTPIQRMKPEQYQKINEMVTYVSSVADSKKLNDKEGPMIIVSASGMASGGRVLHHLKQYAPQEKNTVLFAGYQAGGTRGSKMLNGAEAVKIHGQYIPVRCEVDFLDNLSAHADKEELLNWLKTFPEKPDTTFIVHGEPKSTDSMRMALENKLDWKARVPEYLEKARLEPGNPEFIKPAIPNVHV
ncbi:MAG: MBL fold metallo-hydrolase RNA specificity domain-containing protein [bacterium]